MKEMILEEKVKKFLNKNLDNKKPVLLGYSGGIDSKALFSLLLEYKNIDLHVAHVDHSWRKESSKEAFQIKKELQRLKIPFHLKILKREKVLKNVEDFYRRQRILFFKTLFKKYSFQALILAHQRDDLIETVLKRFLEGASFFNLKSMQEISFMEEMVIWRPLLSFSKKKILSYLEKKGLDPIKDPTNKDVKYLRARMREKIFPYLNKIFGKNIDKNLYAASFSSLEINNYLEKKVKKYFDQRKEGELGLYLDFSNFLHMENLEKKYLINKIVDHLKIFISRDILMRVLFALNNKKRVSFKLKEYNLFVDRSILFFLKKDFYNSFKKIEIKEGEFKFCGWDIRISLQKEIDDRKLSSWEDVWRGDFSILLEKANYHLAFPKREERLFGKRLNKWFSENKVPYFLRFYFPIIYRENRAYFEFLTGKKRYKMMENSSYYKVFLKLSV